jgi:NAD(P)-dependent dehydrogenase (short-subunit alcohol dehydrogenase family)
MMTKQELTGKTAIVTGSSRGIGRAIAEALGRLGANVAVTYHGNRDKAEEVVKTIESFGSKAVALQVDVRDLKSVRELFGEAKKHFGAIDILVNNAAGFNVFKPTEAMSVQEYDSMFLITRGVYFAMQEAAKQLADGGRIVSTSTGRNRDVNGWRGSLRRQQSRRRAIQPGVSQGTRRARHYGQLRFAGRDRHRRTRDAAGSN